MKYTAQEILAMATKEETQALEAWFGPDWVYKARKTDELTNNSNLRYEAIVPESRPIKRAAHEAWERLKADIDRLNTIMPLESTQPGG